MCRFQKYVIIICPSRFSALLCSEQDCLYLPCIDPALLDPHKCPEDEFWGLISDLRIVLIYFVVRLLSEVSYLTWFLSSGSPGVAAET